MGVGRLFVEEMRREEEDLKAVAVAGLANLAVHREIYDGIDTEEILRLVESSNVSTRRSALLVLYFHPGVSRLPDIPLTDTDPVCLNLKHCLHFRKSTSTN